LDYFSTDLYGVKLVIWKKKKKRTQFFVYVLRTQGD
jgi:hypothetical protein